MDYYSSQISRLIEELSKLPGVGAKSAQRLAFHIINMPKEQVEQLAGAMTGARNNVRYCKECFTLTDKELCPICSSKAVPMPRRSLSSFYLLPSLCPDIIINFIS